MCVVCVRVCLCVCACVRAATEATLEEAPAAAVRGAGRRKKGVDCFAKGLFCVFEAAFIHALLVRACMISQESHITVTGLQLFGERTFGVPYW